MDEAYSTHNGNREIHRNLSEGLKVRDQLRDLGIYKNVDGS